MLHLDHSPHVNPETAKDGMQGSTETRTEFIVKLGVEMAKQSVSLTVGDTETTKQSVSLTVGDTETTKQSVRLTMGDTETTKQCVSFT